MSSGRPSIGAEFHARVEAYLKHHPELGYKNTSELVKELLRTWMREQGIEIRNGPEPGRPSQH